MKKFILVVLFASLSAFGSVDRGEDRVVSARLCDSWHYNFDIHEYTCSYVGRLVNLVEAGDHDRTIRALEDRIAQLEAVIAGRP